MKPVPAGSLALLLITISPGALPAQALSVGASRWLTSPRTSEYRLGLDGYRFGSLMFRPALQVLRRGGESNAAWGGVGSDVVVRIDREALPYLIGGMGFGMGRPDSLRGLGPALGLWAGVGAELFTLGPLGLQAEATYAWRARMDVKSFTLGIRAGLRIGGERTREAAEPTAPQRPAALPRSNPADEAVIRNATGRPADAGDAGAGPAGGGSSPSAAAAVVSTALAAMGTPYRWGGSDENGFDCSGLIQYAFAQHGIALPRRSGEQAQAGYEVDRLLDRLLPGDILTFAGDPRRTDQVTHVGLYLGEGRFIHSATGGVQVSLLSPSENAAAWWFDRWVGVRRVQ